MWNWISRILCFGVGCLAGIGIAVKKYEKKNKLT